SGTLSLGSCSRLKITCVAGTGSDGEACVGAEDTDAAGAPAAGSGAMGPEGVNAFGTVGRSSSAFVRIVASASVVCVDATTDSMAAAPPTLRAGAGRFDGDADEDEDPDADEDPD